MSYEYNVFSNISPNNLYSHVKNIITNLPGLHLTWSNDGSCGFRRSTSKSNWDSDIDLSLSSDGVFLCIHAGSTEIVDHINKYLTGIDVCVDFQEL